MRQARVLAMLIASGLWGCAPTLRVELEDAEAERAFTQSASGLAAIIWSTEASACETCTNPATDAACEVVYQGCFPSIGTSLAELQSEVVEVPRDASLCVRVMAVSGEGERLCETDVPMPPASSLECFMTPLPVPPEGMVARLQLYPMDGRGRQRACYNGVTPGG
ncbi:MAG: hypothetical protein AB8I08_12380 [Sandaracinaceae bacterium]